MSTEFGFYSAAFAVCLLTALAVSALHARDRGGALVDERRALGDVVLNVTLHAEHHQGSLAAWVVFDNATLDDTPVVPSVVRPAAGGDLRYGLVGRPESAAAVTSEALSLCCWPPGPLTGFALGALPTSPGAYGGAAFSNDTRTLVVTLGTSGLNGDAAWGRTFVFDVDEREWYEAIDQWPLGPDLVRIGTRIVMDRVFDEPRAETTVRLRFTPAEVRIAWA